MIVSKWDENGGFYRYYELPNGAICIRAKETQWLTFHDIKLHAKGLATEQGTGTQARGLIVASVQEAPNQNDDDSDDMDWLPVIGVGLGLIGLLK